MRIALLILGLVVAGTLPAAARAPWVGSRVVGSPDPPPRFATARVFSGLPIERVLDLKSPPGDKQLWIVDGDGRIRRFDNRPDVDKAVTVLELGKQIFAIAFHPHFARNHFLYAYYDAGGHRPRTFHLSRFTVGADGKVDTASERLLLEHKQDDHFGGSIHFGKDGYLYAGLGDGGGIGDPRSTGQDLSDLQASILRIDVDRTSEGRPYGIPRDNPFIRTPAARPEIFAFGLRNPWRFSFDRATGDLWVGDVGQDLWEMIYLVRKGGNYGWSVREGSHDYHPARPRGPAPIEPPLVEHSHSDARSITGGFVYRGRSMPELVGTYIYGDYDTGTIWGVRKPRAGAARPVQPVELVDTPLRIVAFGEDAAGEIHVLSYPGEIHRLGRAPRAPPPEDDAAFPRLLSQTGLFSSVKDHKPAAGVVPYQVTSPLWSDNAHKERFVAIPGDAAIEVRARPRWDETAWAYPDGSVLVKTFALDLEEGNPRSRKRLETRLWTVQAGQWRGYTYVWNADDSDAELLGPGALERTYTIKDVRAPGGQRQQTWHFPSRAECSLCHTMSAEFVLGFTAAQLDRVGGEGVNQLDALVTAGFFKGDPRRPGHVKLVDPRDTRAPLDARARSYLHANCAHCHRPFGGGYASFHLGINVPTAKTGAINALAERGGFGLADPRVIVPGSPDDSVLLARMKTLGAGRMPSVATSMVDEAGIKLVEQWIRSLPP